METKIDSNDAVIIIENLTKTYVGKKRTRVNALKGISLQINRGEIFGFLGPNGAGKSTTIKSLVGLVKPTSGKASILGESIPSVNSRRNLGYLPENPAFYDFLGAEEYLKFVGKAFKMSATEIAKSSENILKLLELWDARKRPIRGYSKGMVQRVGIAQTMIHDPEIYIFDEPMSGLDPIGRALVKDIMLDLKKKGKTVFFSTHITDDVEKVCDRVGILFNGELKFIDTVEAVMTQGITGYLVKLKLSDGNIVDESVKKDELNTFLYNHEKDGSEIILIEPQRKNLEEFFLSIVKAG